MSVLKILFGYSTFANLPYKFYAHHIGQAVALFVALRSFWSLRAREAATPMHVLHTVPLD
jgi:hypothetical protein